MGGLLNTEGYNFYSVKFAIAVAAEMLGVLLFAFYGDVTPKEYGAWGNGLALATVGVFQNRSFVLLIVFSRVGELSSDALSRSVIASHQSLSCACSLHHCEYQWRACQSVGDCCDDALGAYHSIQRILLHSGPSCGEHTR